MGKVEWSEPAKEDLFEIHKNLSITSNKFAESVLEDLLIKSDLLEHHPRIGKKVKRIEHDNLREVLIRNYRVVYIIESNRVCILRVLHSSVI